MLDKEKLLKFFAPFTGEQINLIGTITSHMLSVGVSLEEVSEMIEAHYAAKLEELETLAISLPKKPKVINKTSVLCSLCGHPAKRLPINNKPSTMVGGTFSVAIQCSNARCLHTKYY